MRQIKCRDEVVSTENRISPAFDLIVRQVQVLKFREVEERVAIYV